MVYDGHAIRENMGNIDVFYTLGGDFDHMNFLDLGVNFNPAIPYNRMDDPHVLAQ